MVDNTAQVRGTVLVIDDEAVVREAVEDVLALIDVVVLMAENGQDGIRLYQEQTDEIDLILLDLTMPGLSGQETLQRLRQFDPTVKVILSSGYSPDEITTPIEGAIDFLQKPYNMERLIKEIRQHLPPPK